MSNNYQLSIIHYPLKSSIVSSVVAFVCNLILAYLAYAVCRVVYVCEN